MRPFAFKSLPPPLPLLFVLILLMLFLLLLLSTFKEEKESQFEWLKDIFFSCCLTVFRVCCFDFTAK